MPNPFPPSEIARQRAVCDGFRGRFFFDAERGDLAYIAKECDDKQCDCSPNLNSDGDQDCSISIGGMGGVDEAVGEPIAKMLNTYPAALDEIERLRGLLREALDLASIDVKSQDEWSRVRALRKDESL